jgi:hypothetical protein
VKAELDGSPCGPVERENWEDCEPMSFDRGEPSLEQIQAWFLYNPPVPPQTFEIALVLGGTVSAGAYTAGVLDFLVEALDSWTEQQSTDKTLPQHNVLLRIVAGTSGGGVNAAILARALNFDFPHLSSGPSPEVPQTGNPFYDVWVNLLTLNRFLDTSDLPTGLLSVLNGSCINEGAKTIIQFQGKRPKVRTWLAAPVRVILTLTNLRGIPYVLNFGRKLGERYIDHADYIRFALAYPYQTISQFRPDELVLGFDQQFPQQQAQWHQFGEFACATSAFPVGFPPRVLERPTAHYAFRVVPRIPEADRPLGGQPAYDVLHPDWDALVDGSGAIPEIYQFLAVDGGATDNEPIELARTGLCGLLASNPRDPTKANRAVILVDPFAGEAELGPKQIGPFASTLGGVANALIQQTRYDSRDLALAADDNVFSRFMITPRRKGVTGSRAIASAGVGAFIGFACPDFMRYDYMLGRRNCQQFLRRTFVLAETNKVFGGSWTEAQKIQFARDVRDRMQPIIPLIGSAAIDQQSDEWPAGRLTPEIYRDAIQRRFQAIAELEVTGGPFRSILGLIGGWALKGSAADFVVDQMRQYLASAKLS